MTFKDFSAILAVGALAAGCCCNAAAADCSTKVGPVSVAVGGDGVAITFNGATDKTALPAGADGKVASESVIVADVNFDGKDDLAVKAGEKGANGVYLFFLFDEGTQKFILADQAEFASMRLNSESGGRRLYLTRADSGKTSTVGEYVWHNGKLTKVVSHKQTKE